MEFNRASVHKSLIGQPNGLRYPLVGGTRQRHFIGTNSKPHELPENAPTPTSRVHAVLARILWTKTALLERNLNLFFVSTKTLQLYSHR